MSAIQSLSIWGDSIAKGIVFDEKRGRYAVFRDNYALKLSREGKFPVENHSVMGATICQAAERLKDDNIRPGGVAAIEFGGNDCDLDWTAVSEQPDRYHEARTPIALFRDTLGTMVQKLRKSGMEIVLVVPPPIDAEKYFAWVSKNLDPRAILKYLGDVQHIYRWQERYALAVRDVARKFGCMMLDLRDAFLAERDFKSLLCVDGIHPSAEGYELIWQEISGMLKGAAT